MCAPPPGCLPELPLLLITPVVSAAPPALRQPPSPEGGQGTHPKPLDGRESKPRAQSGVWGAVGARPFPEGHGPRERAHAAAGEPWLDKAKVLLAEGGEALERGPEWGTLHPWRMATLRQAPSNRSEL